VPCTSFYKDLVTLLFSSSRFSSLKACLADSKYLPFLPRSMAKKCQPSSASQASQLSFVSNIIFSSCFDLLCSFGFVIYSPNLRHIDI
jgi:hypothetical protein